MDSRTSRPFRNLLQQRAISTIADICEFPTSPESAIKIDEICRDLRVAVGKVVLALKQLGLCRGDIQEVGCACRKLTPGILVMQSAQGWATKNVPGAIDGARDRCIFLQG